MQSLAADLNKALSKGDTNKEIVDKLSKELKTSKEKLVETQVIRYGWKNSYEILKFFTYRIMELIKGKLLDLVVTAIKKEQDDLEITFESLIPKGIS